MKILILGGSGMLGHKLAQSWHDRFEVWTTVRADARRFERFGILPPARTIPHVQAENFDTVMHALATARPDVVINAIGVIKQLPSAKDPIPTLTYNSIFPHRVAALCRAAGVRMITFSTDCVFNGRRGNYCEDDYSDAEDLYGRSKYLGEVAGDGAFTLRTSIIGRELETAHSLIEWFLQNRGGRVKGFTNAIYTGFPTIVMADILADLIENHPDLSGVWHVASDPVSKFDLLTMARDAYEADIEIEPYEEFYCDRSMNGERFLAATDFKIPSWQEMINRMAHDPTPYDEWRKVTKV
jgi:dTDP-4-dehydrorhamnose reductase